MNAWKKRWSIMLMAVLFMALSTTVFAQEDIPVQLQTEGDGASDGTESTTTEPVAAEQFVVSFTNGKTTCVEPYTGTQRQPSVEVRVKLSDGTLSEKLVGGVPGKDECRDYILTYQNNVKASTTASVKIKGLEATAYGDLTNLDQTLYFTISKAKLSDTSITLAKTSYSYTGKAQTPAVTVKYGSTTLTEGTDYSLTYANNTAVGTASVTIKGKGNFEGSLKKEFKIKKADLAKATITIKTKYYIYTGKAIKPSISVKMGSKALKNGKDYKISYAKNVAIGKGKVIIKGVSGGNYGGSNSVKFGIKPAKPTLKSLKRVKKGVQITWSGVKGVSGYVVYRRDPKAKKYTKVGVTTKTTFVDKKIVAGKSYIYCVKAYKKGSYKSKKSNLKQITILAQRPKITAVKGSNYFIINWKKISGVTKYVLRRRVVGGAWKTLLTTTSAVSYKDKAVKDTVKYEYCLVAYAGSLKVKSNVLKLSLKDDSKTPSKLAVKQASDKKTFYAAWSAVSGVSGYQIYWVNQADYSKSHYGTTTSTSYSPIESFCGVGTWKVQVRSYVVENGKTIYSPWSSVVTVVIK